MTPKTYDVTGEGTPTVTTGDDVSFTISSDLEDDPFDRIDDVLSSIDVLGRRPKVEPAQQEPRDD